MIRSFFFTLLILFILIASVAKVSALDTISNHVLQVPFPLEESISLDGYIDVALTDDSSNDITKLLQSPEVFKRISGHDVNLGFVRTSVWMRFSLTLPDDAIKPEELILSLKPNFTDELEVYVGRQNAVMTKDDFTRFELGDHAPRAAGSLNTSANIVPLQLRGGEVMVVYIRARNLDASLNVSIELLPQQYYRHEALIQNTMQGAWFGGMTILFVIQFFFYYFDRKKFYALLALDILAVGSTYFGSLGFARLFFFNAGGLGNDLFTSSSSWIGLAAGSLSIAAILQLRKRYPRLHYIFCFAALVGLIGIFCVFTGVNRYFIILAGPVILLITTSAMIVALIDLIRRPCAQQGLNFSAFALLWAGLLITNSQRYGIVHLPGWVASSYAITSIMHFTLLTGSLAVRLRNAEASAREADRRALHVAMSAEQHAIDLVQERTKELRAATKVAENALRAELQAQEQQVRFMEVISHQYRTPLGIIRTNLESVRLTLPKKDEANRQRLDRASIGVTRLVEVLEVNLARSRIQGLTYKPTFARLRVSNLIESAITSARDLLQGAALTATISPEAEKAEVLADAEMLKLAIINLLENAFKFSAPTGSTAVWLDVFRREDELVIEVRDEGIGFQDENIEELIQNKKRGKLVSHIEGTGVGLSLVKRTMELHHGTLVINNRPEGGAVATLTMRIA